MKEKKIIVVLVTLILIVLVAIFGIILPEMKKDSEVADTQHSETVVTAEPMTTFEPTPEPTVELAIEPLYELPDDGELITKYLEDMQFSGYLMYENVSGGVDYPETYSKMVQEHLDELDGIYRAISPDIRYELFILNGEIYCDIVE